MNQFGTRPKARRLMPPVIIMAIMMITGSIKETPEGDFILNVASDTIRVFSDHFREDLDVKHGEYSNRSDDEHPPYALAHLNERENTESKGCSRLLRATMPAMKSNAVSKPFSIGTSFPECKADA